jgi:hypothetical protein
MEISDAVRRYDQSSPSKDFVEADRGPRMTVSFSSRDLPINVAAGTFGHAHRNTKLPRKILYYLGYAG